MRPIWALVAWSDCTANSGTTKVMVGSSPASMVSGPVADLPGATWSTKSRSTPSKGGASGDAATTAPALFTIRIPPEATFGALKPGCCSSCASPKPPGRGHQQQVAQILAKAFDLVLLRRIAAEFIDRADIELDRFVLGERVEVGHVAGEPAVDFGHAAVGHDAEAHLPLRQLAPARFVHEAVDGPDADHAQHHQDARREQDLEIKATFRSAGIEHSAGGFPLGSPIRPRLRACATLSHCPLLTSSV